MTDDMPQGKRTVSDSEIIEAIRKHEDPIVRADEVADIFDHTRQWAHDRLQALVDSGELAKKGGERSKVWWDPDQIR